MEEKRGVGRPPFRERRHTVMLSVPPEKYELLQRQSAELGLPCTSYCLMLVLRSLQSEENKAAA